jgi:hypothetical protein
MPAVCGAIHSGSISSFQFSVFEIPSLYSSFILHRSSFFLQEKKRSVPSDTERSSFLPVRALGPGDFLLFRSG